MNKDNRQDPSEDALINPPTAEDCMAMRDRLPPILVAPVAKAPSEATGITPDVRNSGVNLEATTVGKARRPEPILVPFVRNWEAEYFPLAAISQGIRGIKGLMAAASVGPPDRIAMLKIENALGTIQVLLAQHSIVVENACGPPGADAESYDTERGLAGLTWLEHADLCERATVIFERLPGEGDTIARRLIDVALWSWWCAANTFKRPAADYDSPRAFPAGIVEAYARMGRAHGRFGDPKKAGAIYGNASEYAGHVKVLDEYNHVAEAQAGLAYFDARERGKVTRKLERDYCRIRNRNISARH